MSFYSSKLKERKLDLEISNLANFSCGIVYLDERNYLEALNSFLLCDLKNYENLSNEVLNVDNVITYVIFCFLISFHPKKMNNLIIKNSNFELFFKKETKLNKALKKFLNYEYEDCLSILEHLKNNFLLDVYLSPHVDYFFLKIKTDSLLEIDSNVKLNAFISKILKIQTPNFLVEGVFFF